MPHSRIARNEAFRKWREQAAASTIIDESRKWFYERVVDSSVNPFNRNFAERFPLLEGEKLAVFFTSSADEFESFWNEWTTLGWSDQYESFYAIAAHLKSRGYRLVLRLHPHLSSKSTPSVLEDFRQALRLGTDHGVELVAPGSKVSTYDLVSKADVVIVSQSTVGLEALHLGKKVIATANCFYDICEDVLLFKKISSFNEIEAHLVVQNRDPNFSVEYVTFEISKDFQRISVFVGDSTINEKLKSFFYFRNFLYFTTIFLSEFLDNLIIQFLIRNRLRVFEKKGLRIH
jgi:hypothetical protein